MTVKEMIDLRMMDKFRKNKAESDPIKYSFNQGYVSALDNLRFKNPKERKSFIDKQFELSKRWMYLIPDYDIDNKQRASQIKGTLAAITDLKRIERKFGNNVYGENRKKKFLKWR